MNNTSARVIWFAVAIAVFCAAWFLLVGATSHLPDNPSDPNDTKGIHISAVVLTVMVVMAGLWFVAIALLWGLSRLSIGQGKYASITIRILQGALLASLGLFGAMAAYEYGADSLKGIASGLLFSLLVVLAVVPFRYLGTRQKR
ncbi:MAG: hypothetical protein RSE94_03600 [Pseudomonas sp.]